jgi:hypothetical protein
MNRIDAGYRSLICAIIIRAVRDVQEGRDADEARAFLVSPECRRLALLASIRWTVDEGDIDLAVQRLGNKRTRLARTKPREHECVAVGFNQGQT